MNWSDIRYFKENEAWGDPDKMDYHFMKLLDTLRSLVNNPFVIHCGYENGGHANQSYHYVGRAADFHVLNLPPLKALHKIEQILVDMDIPDRVGLGYYPHWYTPGFHFDDRGWDGQGRPKKQGSFWVRLDHAEFGFKSGYYYNEIAEKIIKRIEHDKM